jgi:hypothetical protein
MRTLRTCPHARRRLDAARRGANDMVVVRP